CSAWANSLSSHLF
nr:immunoglobulin light chain junction region [Macaca mulatta]MPO05205.1 immunoglobulin light chain junction region [Macaca mulatta]MPO06128.1 immunoglobulin light chain junction region [Macaca mulatta]